MLPDAELIRRLPLFSTLTMEQAQQVADVVVKRTFVRGHHVVEQGRKSDILFLLLSGRARVVRADASGREVIKVTN